jgi:hypothetical protein
VAPRKRERGRMRGLLDCEIANANTALTYKLAAVTSAIATTSSTSTNPWQAWNSLPLNV